MKCSEIGCTNDVPDKPTLQMGSQAIYLCPQHKHEALQADKPLRVEGSKL